MSDSAFVWVEVKREGLWKPTREGDMLEGRYGGIQVANGPTGPFDVLEVRDDRGRIFGVSGVSAVNLVRAAGLRDGERMRLVYTGEVPAAAGRNPMRTFKLFVAVRSAGPVWGGGPAPAQEVEPPPVDRDDPGPTPPPAGTPYDRGSNIEPDLD